MVDKKKLQNVLHNNEQEPKKPVDESMTLNVKNPELEEKVAAYLQEKNGENLGALVNLIRTKRVLVPANLDANEKPQPCLITGPDKNAFLPVFTSKEQIPEEPKSSVIVNMPYLAANHIVSLQEERVAGIVINPFSQNLVFKRNLVEKIEEMEKNRKAGVQTKTVQMTPEQYFLFERKQFEFGHLPKRFFAQGKQMLEELCERKEEYIDEIFEEGYQQKRMYPYLEEEFAVMVMKISEELLVVRVDLPDKDMGLPSCYRIFFTWNNVTGEGRYFTIERTKEKGVRLLGEVGSDLKHIDHGMAPEEGVELPHILAIIKKQNA